jgi:hypothetical protein
MTSETKYHLRRFPSLVRARPKFRMQRAGRPACFSFRAAPAWPKWTGKRSGWTGQAFGLYCEQLGDDRRRHCEIECDYPGQEFQPGLNARQPVFVLRHFPGGLVALVSPTAVHCAGRAQREASGSRRFRVRARDSSRPCHAQFAHTTVLPAAARASLRLHRPPPLRCPHARGLP